MTGVTVKIDGSTYWNGRCDKDNIDDFYAFVRFATTGPGSFEMFQSVVTGQLDGPGVHGGWVQTSRAINPLASVDIDAMTAVFKNVELSLLHMPDSLDPLPGFAKDLEWYHSWNVERDDRLADESGSSVPVIPNEDTLPANMVSSKIEGSNKHKVILDIDCEAKLIPSSTPGHYHLYIDKTLDSEGMGSLVGSLFRAGIISEGNFNQWDHFGGQYLRLPFLRKGQVDRFRGVDKMSELDVALLELGELTPPPIIF